MEILIPAERIQKRVGELAQQIAADYHDQRVTIVGVLTGSLIFLADLIRRLDLPLRVALIQASSYRGNATLPGELHVAPELVPDVRGRNVLLLDDILDTGQTLNYLVAHLRALGASAARGRVASQGRPAETADRARLLRVHDSGRVRGWLRTRLQRRVSQPAVHRGANAREPRSKRGRRFKSNAPSAPTGQGMTPCPKRSSSSLISATAAPPSNCCCLCPRSGVPAWMLVSARWADRPMGGIPRGAGHPSELPGWKERLEVRPLLRLRELIREERPALIHAWGLVALRAVAWTGVASRSHVVLGSHRSSRPHWLDRWLLKQAAHVTALSTFQRERLLACGLPAEHVSYLPPESKCQRAPPHRSAIN